MDLLDALMQIFAVTGALNDDLSHGTQYHPYKKDNVKKTHNTTTTKIIQGPIQRPNQRTMIFVVSPAASPISDESLRPNSAPRRSHRRAPGGGTSSKSDPMEASVEFMFWTNIPIIPKHLNFLGHDFGRIPLQESPLPPFKVTSPGTSASLGPSKFSAVEKT